MELGDLMALTNGGTSGGVLTTATPAPSPTASQPAPAGPPPATDAMVLPHALGGGAVVFLFGAAAIALGYWAGKAGVTV